ncbi:HNH endonuclease, partial [Escherichia coli]
DMIPLCPNCHAMVHRGSETLKVEELKKKMRFWS